MQFDQIVRRVAQPGDGTDTLATDRDAPTLAKSERPHDVGLLHAHRHEELLRDGGLRAANIEPEEPAGGNPLAQVRDRSRMLHACDVDDADRRWKRFILGRAADPRILVGAGCCQLSYVRVECARGCCVFFWAAAGIPSAVAVRRMRRQCRVVAGTYWQAADGERIGHGCFAQAISARQGRRDEPASRPASAAARRPSADQSGPPQPRATTPTGRLCTRLAVGICTAWCSASVSAIRRSLDRERRRHPGWAVVFLDDLATIGLVDVAVEQRPGENVVRAGRQDGCQPVGRQGNRSRHVVIGQRRYDPVARSRSTSRAATRAP